MGADLQTLYDLFADSADSIPPMLLEKRQLETIVEAWNDLKEYCMCLLCLLLFLTRSPCGLTHSYCSWEVH
jgi:hypothetical protein